ncbi:MAG: peptidylprolyl isomerase, partial [Desulfobacterales bacterium]|nr:peptidylprolyl isomerase [Desulfobacterales bacterium]
FKMPESRRLREILIKVDPSAPEETWQKKKEYTEGILKRARSGEDFRTLAWNYSTDKYRVKEGDLGVVHEGRLQPELQEIAWKMKAGEISDVIR